MDSRDAILQLVAPLERQMFSTVWRVLRHPQDAEDAFQNALATVWQKRSQIERHTSPQALILKICADAAIDQFRRRNRSRDRSKGAMPGGDLPATQREPIDDAIEHETLDLIMAAIARLSPNQATAIVMRYIEEESHATIAAALGCGTETVREHLARGRERLGRLLAHLSPRRASNPNG